VATPINYYYIRKLLFMNAWTNRQTDRQTDREILHTLHLCGAHSGLPQ